MQETYDVNPSLINNLVRFIDLVKECELLYEIEFCDNYTTATVVGSNLEYEYKDAISNEIEGCLSMKIYF